MARPWERRFLGYSMTPNRKSRLKVAKESVKRLKGKLREIFRRGQGRSLERLIVGDLTPLLRGWMNYFRLAEVKGVFEELDGWIRRKIARSDLASMAARYYSCQKPDATRSG